VHPNRSGAIWPRRILIAVVAALVPMIAGCDAGTNAPVLHWHPQTDGTYHAVGDITISNAFVLGAPIGAALRPGQNAGLFLGLVNVGPSDRLVSISAPGVAQSVQLPGNQVVLASQQPVLLTGPAPAVILENLLRPLAAGSVLSITLNFKTAGAVTIKVPVLPRVQYYTTLSPAPTPTTPTPTPTATPKPTASKSP